MRIGVSAPECRGPGNPAAVRAAATAAEQLGYESLWLSDRVGGLDPIALLASAAAATTRIRLGVSVFVVPWYPPLILARSLRALDTLSDGRLVVGLGLGRSPEEARLVGADVPNRGERLEQLLDLLDAGAAPRPSVLLGASSAVGRDRVARRADGWHPAGMPLDELAPMWAEIRDRAAAYGRDPDGLQLVVRADVAVTVEAVHGAGGRRPAFCGTVDQIADDLERVRRAGAHEVLLAVNPESGFDDALDVYARLAETVGGRAGQLTAPSPIGTP